MSTCRSAIQEARELLQGYLVHVPPSINSASIDTVRRFKDDIKYGKRRVGNPRSTLMDLQGAINQLDRYWR